MVMRSGNAAATSSVFVPIEPVLPRTATRRGTTDEVTAGSLTRHRQREKETSERERILRRTGSESQGRV